MTGVLLGRALAPAAEAAPLTTLSTQLAVEVSVTPLGPAPELIREDNRFVEENFFDPQVRTAVIIRGTDPDVPWGPFSSGQYPETVNPNLPAFAAADVTGDGAYGAGVSGIHFAPGIWEAKAGFAFSVDNPLSTDAAIEATFHIPRLEASIAGVRGLSAEATARGLYSLYQPGAGGGEGEFFDRQVFEVGLGSRVSPDGLLGYSLTPDLITVIDLLDLKTDLDHRQAGGYDIQSYTVPGFSISYTVPLVPPGWIVDFTIIGEAIMLVDFNGVEQGAQALVGDPFNPSIGGGPVLRWLLGDGDDPGPIVGGPPPGPVPAPIPLPASAWLILAGSAALASVRACRESARRRRT